MSTLVLLPKRVFSKMKSNLLNISGRKQRDKKSDSRKRSAAKLTASSKNGECHLLALPAELRNLIYEYILVGSRAIIKLSDRRKPKSSQGAAQPPITRVCKPLRNETLAMFYSVTPFCFTALPIRPGSKKHVKDKALATLAPYVHLMKDIKIEIRNPTCSHSPTAEIYVILEYRILFARVEDQTLLNYTYPLGASSTTIQYLDDQRLLAEDRLKVYAGASLQ